MNTVPIKRSHLTITLIAVAFLLILVIAQYLQRPMSPVTPNALKFLETLREATAATIVSRDGSLQLFSGGDDPTPIKKSGQSQGTDIPAECKPDLESPVNQLTIYKGKPDSSEATFFITTQGGVSCYSHCPLGKQFC